MNVFNLFGQGKPKNDPYWEFKPSQHFRPKLSTGDFYKLTSFDFGWFVIEVISDYLKDRKGELRRGKHLSYGQKAIYYWWYVDAEVTNGGFIQFYYNGYARYIPTIIKGLRHIDANKMADLISRSYELYLKKSKKIKRARLGGLQAFSNLYEEIKDFDELDEEYYDLHDQTMKNIEKYIRNNAHEFCLDEEGKEFNLDRSGEIRTYYSNKGIKEVIPLHKGLVSGYFKSYYENGQLKEEIPYVEGKLTGQRIEYYSNGNRKFSITESQNPKGNLHTHYYENGNLKSTQIYITDYERDGKWIRYYSNGQMKSETEFINKEFFVQNCWREDGTQIMKNGTGLYIHEYSIIDGVLERNEHEYKNFKRHGKQYSYRNDKLTLYQEMVEGKEHGVTKSFDDIGNLKEEIIYQSGKMVSRKKIRK